MNVRLGPVVLLFLGFILLAVGGEIDSILGTIIMASGGACLLLSGIVAIVELRGGRKNSENGRVAENNAAVIRNVYNQLLKEGGKKDEDTFLKLCYAILQDEEHAHAALDFAKKQAKSQGEELALHRVAFSILVGQMFAQKGSEPNQEEKLIAFAAVKEVIGWNGHRSSSSVSHTGLGGWLAVFIVETVIWTVACTAGAISLLIMFATGNYNTSADGSTILLVALLTLYVVVLSVMGMWLLVLLAKRRKLAIRVGKIFSILSLAIVWVFYLHDSKRVKNTLVN